MDVTNRNFAVPGVNSVANYIESKAFEFDFANVADITAVGTHDVVKLEDDKAVVGLKVIVIDKATSSGSATLQFKVNGSAVNSSAVALSALDAGYVHNFAVSGAKAYGENTLSIVVGTAAFTGGKLLVIVDTIPAKMFVTAG